MIWFLPMMAMVLLSIPVAFSLGLAGFFGIVYSLNWTAGCAFVNWIDRRTRLRTAVTLLALLTLGIALLSLFGTDWSKVRLLDLPWLYERLPNLVRGLPGRTAPE